MYIVRELSETDPKVRGIFTTLADARVMAIALSAGAGDSWAWSNPVLEVVDPSGEEVAEIYRHGCLDVQENTDDDD